MVLRTRTLNVSYENGFLRRILYGEHEIVRMVYFALRDESWETLPYRIENEKLEEALDFFRIEYECIHFLNNDDIFKWRVKISGESDDTIAFEVQGTALKDFRRNRAGICILHPIHGVAGENAVVVHPDNSIERKRFPLQVAPVNPFKDIRKLRWYSDGEEFEFIVEGDIFETEDQRNWTDASFKTFCTPAHLPIPVLIRANETIFQRVIFRPVSVLPIRRATERSIIRLTRTDVKARLPNIGIGASTEIQTLNERVLKKIRSLELDHYRIEVVPSHSHWVTDFSNEYQQSFEMNLPLEVGLHLTDDYKHEIDSFVTLCLQNRVKLKYVILLSENLPVTSQDVIHYSFEMKKHLPGVLIGAGTDYNFYELNTNRLNNKGLPFITYPITPQVHAFDDQTIIENIEGQYHTAVTAGEIFPGQRIHISPITLRKRNNPAAAKESERLLPNVAKADPRQSSELAALFTFGSLRALSESHASSVTYYQTSGDQGILSGEGDPFPAYRVFELINRFKQSDLIILKNPDPLSIDVMCFENGDSTTLLLANYTSEERIIEFESNRILLNPQELKKEVLNRPQQL